MTRRRKRSEKATDRITETITRKKDKFVIENLEITDREMIEILETYSVAEWEEVTLRALRIGLLVIKDFQAVGKVDWIEKQIKTFQSELTNLILYLQKELEDYLGEEGILSVQLDPDEEDSILARIEGALTGPESSFVRLLNPDEEGSLMAKFEHSLRKELLLIQESIARQTGIEEEAARGTQKGFKFEEEVVESLQGIAKHFGDEVELVGKKQRGRRKVGDILISVNDDRLAEMPGIVIEAKDRQSISLSRFAEEVRQGMENRDADWGIGVVHNPEALPQKVGDFAQIGPDVIVCAYGESGLPLEIAYKLARCHVITQYLRDLEIGGPEINIEEILTTIEEIKMRLKEFRTIKSQLTLISNTSDEIRGSIDSFRIEIKESLDELQDLVTPKKKDYEEKYYMEEELKKMKKRELQKILEDRFNLEEEEIKGQRKIDLIKNILELQEDDY